MLVKNITPKQAQERLDRLANFHVPRPPPEAVFRGFDQTRRDMLLQRGTVAIGE